jgi:murein DD-endopeptidase MepM/ murein hydrolase activator NlpD
MELILKTLLLFLTPISAHTDIEVFVGNPVNIYWQEYGQEYEYMVELYQLQARQESLIYTSEWILENELELNIEQEGSYLWKTYIKEIDKSCDDDHQCFNVESGYFDFFFPEEEEEPKVIQEPKIEKKEEVEEVVIPEKETEDIVDEKVLGSATNRYIPKEEKKEEVQPKDEKKDVKENSCRYIYNTQKDSFTLKECNIKQPSLSSSTYYSYKDSYIVNSKGGYEDTVGVYIENSVCKNFHLLNPKTWFGCDEVVMDSSEYDVKFNHEVYFFKDRIISPSNFIFRDTDFEISSVLNSLPTDLVFKGYFSLNHREKWLDQEVAIKLPITFKEVESKSNGIYSFPFSKIVYVNQWHGCTKYQCPHKGIDFASTREKIYAGGDGVVVSKGYDTYGGECNSGGNYLNIKYDDGHHMVYMHLEKSYVSTNQRVKRGDLIALSGNSGAHNCQPLGHHLHYELREGRRQSTHINPVPFLDVDWFLVKTNRSDLFPKRLSGDNPHPSF